MTARVRLLPDHDQRQALQATLERANRVSNAVRVAASEARLTRANDIRPLVKAETERQKLPATFNKPIAERVAAVLAKLGKQPKFSAYQSITLPASALKFPSTDRVNLPTAHGRRTVPVHVDRARGDLRSPLEGHPVTIVFANGEFDLVAAD